MPLESKACIEYNMLTYKLKLVHRPYFTDIASSRRTAQGRAVTYTAKVNVQYLRNNA